jgi:uncharacterized membrane protein YfcA
MTSGYGAEPVTLLSMSVLVWVGSFLAGFLGALTGLGGGVVIVPLLVLVFHVDLRYAAGASLLSVIATSSGAAAAYVREGITNVRVGMFLEIATTIGALAGAVIAAHIATDAIGVIFGLVLLGAAGASILRASQTHGPEPRANPIAQALRLDGTYPEQGRSVAYHVQRVPAGFGLMFVAGALSGLLGIGSGAFKVVAMDQVMRLPFRVSTTTSNFMIGVTAAASAGIYLAHGYLEPGIAAPVVLGVLPGALLGARLFPRIHGRQLRFIFAIVVAVVAIQMIFKGATGKL